MNEDKKKIVENLMKLLKQTREGSTIKNMTYRKGYGDSEYVDVEFFSGKKTINVSMDSGTAMIRDIMKVID